ncbi:dTDP-glucose 4,6-dehydratase [Streptomyces sp. NPDC059639]|uniref:dTDP-glucose 4,6-dehydratase n=1 Tax=Streptomyces sp. NPDC059639 TaxID=3346891 RepID=UPI0036A136F5
MRIFVTGGAGFIGSRFVRGLLADEYTGWEGAQVTVVDKLTYAGKRANLPTGDPRLTFVRGDICDTDLMRDLMPGHDAVVHFAAESHVDRSLASAEPFVRTNVLGTQTVLDAVVAGGVERVVHISTDEVYGSIAEGSWTEEWPLAPNSPYAASKAASDLVARSYWRSHGIDLSITRCSNNYGPYQDVEKLIPYFATSLLQGASVPLYGDGSHVREWLHVDDHCRAIALVLNKGQAGEVYNVGGGNERTNRALTERLLELTGRGWDLVRHVPDRKAHDRRYSLDETKIAQQLGYAPRTPFEQGLADTVAWYRDNADWWRPATTDKDAA